MLKKMAQRGQHLKNFEIENLSNKYHGEHVGSVALESILKGESIYTCGATDCMYTKQEPTFSRAEINELIRKHPEKEIFIMRYNIMFDDDLFYLPRQYETLSVTCECGWTNHSCDPNCYYKNTAPYALTALRDIKPGEELCIHYGMYDTENALIAGLKCQCGSEKCAGILKFDDWRDPEFQMKYYKEAMSPHVQRKVDRLRREQEDKQSRRA